MAAKNTKFAVDPKLYNGRLLLFYNGEHGNTSVMWNKDESSIIHKADGNWKQMTSN